MDEGTIHTSAQSAPEPTTPQPNTSTHLDQVIARFQNDSWTAGVIGLGYVGLPLATTACSQGLHVIGFDTNPDLVGRACPSSRQQQPSRSGSRRSIRVRGLVGTASRWIRSSWRGEPASFV